MEGTSDLSLLGENFDSGLMGRIKDNDYESRSGSDNFDGSGDDLDVGEEQPPRKKKYHRHTPQQIQELETFFKECPHPDEKQRTDLSRRLGLENKQVKFWFQNRRTQMKTQLERHENMMLRQENEKLRAENSVMKEAMANPMCNSCGGPAIPGQISFEEHQVRIENARLKDELNRICILANKFIGKSLSPLVGPMGIQSPNSGLDLAIGMNGIGGSNNLGMPFSMGLDMGDGVFGTPPPMSGIRSPPMGLMGNQTNLDRSIVIDLALAAMDELIKMAQPDSPLWIKSSDGKKDVLNQEEYARLIPPCIGPKPNGYVTEATRETAAIIGNSMAIVETLMDVDRWLEMFPSIVARAAILEAISGGMGGTRNGALQVMLAEVHLPSPLVPVRQLSFLRFCKQHAEGVWAVVDVSVDIGNATNGHPFMTCRRLPSGCVVQDVSNGLSKVTWIEHSQYDESAVHQLFRPLVNSGIGFGAQRWIASLQRQNECLAILLSSPIPSEDPTGLSQAGRRSLVKLAQRITNNFFTGICASAAQKWETLQVDGLGDTMKIMARKSIASEPSGIVLSAATSVWMPVSQQRLFDFLRDERLRGQWDVLASNEPMHELFHISKGQGHGNCVSVLRRSANGPENHMLVLQDAWSDNSSSGVVYVPIDMESLNSLMNGGDSAVGLLPSGFVILPDGHSNGYYNGDSSNGSGSGSGSGSGCGGDGGGSLLTFGLQILLNTIPNANKLSVESVISVNSLISETLQKIKAALRVA